MKRNNNILSTIHRLVTSEHGENYWFDGCAAYVMECLGEKDYTYSFFAGLTGDNFTQHYRFNFMGDGVNACHQYNGDGHFFENVFAKCGYFATFLHSRELMEHPEDHLSSLMSCIDKGVPVITLGNDGPPFGVFVGYEESGKTLLYMSGDNDEPQRVTLEKAIYSNKPDIDGWILIGEKKQSVSLAKLYRDAIISLPKLLVKNDEHYCFGAFAFRKWADDIASGVFENMTPEQFDSWSMHQNFVCVLSTNSGGCQGFLEKARELNTDMSFLADISALYHKTGILWRELEELGGGFNITLEALQNQNKRLAIADKLREFAAVIDEVVNVLTNALGSTTFLSENQ